MILGSWVGAPIKEFIKVYGEPIKIISGSNDGKIYIHKLRGREDCTVFWDVNQNNIIVSWRYEGSDCKQEPNII
jgi:hypothetical protein